MSVSARFLHGLARCCAGLIPLSLGAGVPTDNPVAAFYAGDPHAADYAWVDLLAWENVHNILDYGAVADGNGVGDGVGVTDNRAAFHAAVEAAYLDGGGVVYIPAGTYYFSDHLFLKSGVVVRGATPAQTDAHADDFAPPTKLEFPRYFFDPAANDGAGNPNSSAFKHIYVDDNSYASDIGLVWLDINRAGISMSSDGDGTENRLVFGTRTNNVAIADSAIPQLTRTVDSVPQPFQHAWQRFSWRFGRNIHVFGQRNILVGNNRVNDKHYIADHQLPGWETIGNDDFLQVGYIIQDTKRAFGSDSTAFVALQEQHRPWFRYADHYGIYVRGSSGSVWGAAPFENPSVFRPGATIRDNWVYTTMRVGYHLSGWGLKVLNNVKKDHGTKPWWLHPTGLTSVSGAQTLENRGIDISGSNILVEGNELEVHRHRVNNGGYFSTDGEGILVQECCGGTTLDKVFIRDNLTNSYIGIYKMPYTRGIEVTGNTLSLRDGSSNDPAYIMVHADQNGSQGPVFDILVADNTYTASGSILVRGTSGGGGVVIRDNTLAGGGISYPDGITSLSGNTGESGLTPLAIGGVRDHPVLVLEDPSTGGAVAPGETTVRARVTGSFLNPAPADASGLPEIVEVDIYANQTRIGNFTTNSLDPESVAWLYETGWRPAPGYYQLSAKAVPAGYSGPYTSTEWFTVSDVIPVVVGGASGDDLHASWTAAHFPGETDPQVIGGEADPDQDGLPNALEFAIGADPTTPDPALAPAMIMEADSVRLRFRLRDDLGGKVHYRVLQSTDLQAWSPVPATALAYVREGGDLPAGVKEYEYVAPSSPSAPVMLRLEIRQKP
jgi:hypothetical protein